MAEKTVKIPVLTEKPIKITKWKVKEGGFVSNGQIILLYVHDGDTKCEVKRLKANMTGTVKAIKLKEGDVAQPGATLVELAACKHPTVMKDLCAECGADLRTEEQPQGGAAIVPMIHSVPELKVSEELAQKLGREDNERLLRDRKLVLLVDLDQTLVHTTNDNIPANLKGVHHFTLQGPGNTSRWYHTRLRPGTEKFLATATQRFELHVCTFGARQYAHAISRLLDPKQELFSHRILSRDECFDPRIKAANLKALFPCGDELVCIIDDREDVWRHASNLIHVRPYNYFEHTGDINAPPGFKGATEMKSCEASPTKTTGEVTNETLSLQVEAPKSAENEAMKSVEVKSDFTEINHKESAENDTSKKILEKEQTKSENVLEKTLVSEETKKCTENTLKEGDILEQNDNNDSKSGDDASNAVNQFKGPGSWKETSDGMIEIDDPDDYLIYLEDILERIHKYFYEEFDKMKSGQMPDLKRVIPCVRERVLAGTSLVFSGLVPTHQRLQASRAYLLATSLGADVTQDFTSRTTHLVAVRAGTAKVNTGRRTAGKAPLHIVTPDWLWSCAERWERVDERLYPLQRGTQSAARRPPPHCSSPPHCVQAGVGQVGSVTAAPRRRTPSGRFMDSINPLLSFSSADIADMDREVEDIFNESDESEVEPEPRPDNDQEGMLAHDQNEQETTDSRLCDDLYDKSSTSSSSAESLSGGEHPRGWSPPVTIRKRRHSSSSSGSSVSLHPEGDSTCDSFSNERFRRGAAPPTDAPDGSDTNGSDEVRDEADDGEWHMMGAALEREFLGLED